MWQADKRRQRGTSGLRLDVRRVELLVQENGADRALDRGEYSFPIEFEIGVPRCKASDKTESTK